MGANAQRRRLAALPSPPEAEAEETVEMTTIPVRLATGRPAIISVPTDVTDFEWLGFIDATLKVGDHLRQQRPRSRLVVPS